MDRTPISWISCNGRWNFFTTSPPAKPRWKDHDAMIFVFWMLSFKPTFSVSSFTVIKRLFSSLVRVFPICKTSQEKPIWYRYLYNRHFWRDAKAQNMGEGWSWRAHRSCLSTITETGCKGLMGFTSSSGHEACWHFMAFLVTVSQPENLFFPGVNFLKPSPTLQMKLHSYRVRV